MVEEGQKDQGPEVVTDYKEISSRYNKEAARVSLLQLW